MRKGANKKTKPGDRSISPQISSSTSPIAMMAIGAMIWVMLMMSALVKKFEAAEEMNPK